MKKKLNFWLMAALVCSLCMSIASCKDDDKDEKEDPNSGQTDEQAEKDMADAAIFWDVVGQLTDTPMPDNWQNATYEPSIGQPDGTNTAVRIVNCADAETAAARAADLLGGNITESTQDYTYQNDLVGTLTYHKTGGASLATVDVSIKQMPGLSQIIYKTPEQIGDNASFKGTAYYRFGDVVKKLNKDGEYDYWICVRPCFGPASKTDSHWITLSKLPNENIKESSEKKVGDKKFKHYLPKNLASSSDHMQNMAEMVYAMTNPTDWATNLSTNKGYQKLKYFGDFSYEKNFKYNNEWFFNNVANGWENNEGGDLFQAIFGLSREALKTHVQQKGFAMVYGNGTISGNDITLTVYKFAGTNLKTKNSIKSTSKWDFGSFDINQLMSKHYIDNEMVAPAEDGCYWVARYATGETLAKGADATKFDKQKKLPNCEDVFVYNRDVDDLDMTEETLKATEPKIAGEYGNQKGHYQLGDIIMYNKRYYVCASDHDFGETARFVTLNDQETHSTKTFPWDDYGNDVVYDDDMASAETLTAWITNILLDDHMCEVLRGAMGDLNAASTNMVVPEDENMRKYIIGLMSTSDSYVTNANKVYRETMRNALTSGVWQYLYERQNDNDPNIDFILCAPIVYLLADKMRYSTHLFDDTDHWVPYLVISREGNDFDRLKIAIEGGNGEAGDETQTTLSPSHFQWKDMGVFQSKTNTIDKLANKRYHVVKLAMYWLHVTSHDMGDYRFNMLIDLTKNWLEHPNDRVKQQMLETPDVWHTMNITSREITFTDDGKKQTKYTSANVASER